MDTLQIRVGRNQARHHSIVSAILSIEDDHVADRRAPLSAWPLAATRNGGSNVNRELAFSVTGLACNGGVLPARDSARPQEIYLFWNDVSRAAGYQVSGSFGLEPFVTPSSRRRRLNNSFCLINLSIGVAHWSRALVAISIVVP